jgi:hypothetical protein
MKVQIPADFANILNQCRLNSPYQHASSELFGCPRFKSKVSDLSFTGGSLVVHC